MPTTLQTKFLEDSQGNKYAPVTTPNAVRFPDGTNLNDHLGDGMKPEKLTIRLVPPEGSSTSVLDGVPIRIGVEYSTGSNYDVKIILDTTWEGSDIELELGTTWPVTVLIDAQFSSRYIPVATDDTYILGYWYENGHKALVCKILPLFNNERTLEINYIDIQTAVATIYIDDTINDPNNKITRSPADIALMDCIKSKFHRYLGKYDNGVLKMCQLWDNNSYYFSDGHYDNTGNFTGTPASTQGYMGDVFVNCELPIYTRYSVDTSLGHNRHKIEISFANGGSGWKEWHFGFGQDRDVIGAYKLVAAPIVENPSSPADYKPSSVSNQTPIHFCNYSDLVNVFQNSPFRMVSWDEHNIIAVLFYAMYGTTNSVEQLGITTQWDDGKPISNGIYTDPIGVVETGQWNGATSTNFLGLENWIGNVGEVIGNARCNVSQLDGSITVTDRNGTRSIAFPDPTYTYEDDGQTITTYSSSIFPKMQFGQNLDVVAATDAVDYDYNQYDGQAYNDQQLNLPASYRVNAVVVRTGAPVYFSEINFSDVYFEGVSSFVILSSETAAQEGGFTLIGVGSRMCYTGTTQLIADPADYLALFSNQ